MDISAAMRGFRWLSNFSLSRCFKSKAAALARSGVLGVLAAAGRFNMAENDTTWEAEKHQMAEEILSLVYRASNKHQ